MKARRIPPVLVFSALIMMTAMGVLLAVTTVGCRQILSLDDPATDAGAASDGGFGSDAPSSNLDGGSKVDSGGGTLDGGPCVFDKAGSTFGNCTFGP